jgi:hypothetical protein
MLALIIFFVSVSFKSQLFILRHALSTILSGITTSTVASRFFFLVLFYLNITTCEIPFSLSLFSSFPFVCICMRPMQNNHTMMNPCNCHNDKRRRLMLTILFFALLLFHIFLRASLCICMCDRSLVRLC